MPHHSRLCMLQQVCVKFAFVFLLLINSSFCWWDLGHMLVAKVAENTLKEENNILKGENNILKGDHQCIQDIAKHI